MVDFFRLQMNTAQMMVEAQTVITLRVLGMMGVLPAARGETVRMVTEKQEAFAKSWIAASTALMTGESTQKVYAKALAPIGSRTRSNSRRLTRSAMR
jgi:hypothetical protein